MSPPRLATCGLVAGVQLIWTSSPTGDDYVSQRAWESATLERCPFHDGGGCGVGPLGSYPRVWPVGARVPRFWCPKQRASISLLPEFLAAQMSGSLDAVEAVVEAVERDGIAQAVEHVRPGDVDDAVDLPSAIRWVERRVRPVRAALRVAVTLLEELTGCAPTVAAIRERLGVLGVLRDLRRRFVRLLGVLPAPFGLRPRGVA